MQFRELWTTLLRRWYLTLAAIVLAGVAGAGAVFLVGPTYEVKASVLITPPGTTVTQATGVPEGAIGNPLLALDGLNQARDLVIQSITSQQSFEDMCQRDGDAEYAAMQRELCRPRAGVTFEVTPEYASNAPLVRIVATADSRQNAVVALNTMVDQIPDALSELQAGFSLQPDSLIGSVPVVVEQNPTPMRSSQIRAGVLGGGVALSLALLGIAFFEGLIGPRSAASPTRADDGPAATHGQPPLPEDELLHDDKADRESANPAVEPASARLTS
ncbi:MAG: Wzz/FepE/Etk N-terminal domain-containing protein [Actinomycetales bacterium]